MREARAPRWETGAGRNALLGFSGVCALSMRGTAATNTLSNMADIVMVQKWFGDAANVSTTRHKYRHKTG